jgi:PAS domain S-box-containing protein
MGSTRALPHARGGAPVPENELAKANEIQFRKDEIVRSEEVFRLLVQGVKDYAIFMLDPNGIVSSWNEGARRLKGYERSEIIGQHFSKFYLPPDVLRKHPQDELETARKVGRYEEEGWRLRKDGTRFWANVLITRIEDSDGNIVGYSKVTRDLTERKQLEDSLEMRVKVRTEELALALSTRDEFLSIASHELKTPLTSLKLQLQLAMRNREKLTPQALSSAFDMCLRQTNSLVELVDALLDVSRIQTGTLTLSLENVALAGLVQETLERFTQQFAAAKMKVTLDLQNDILGYWDRRRLEQVITNLLSNAIKYAPRSQLTVTAKTSEGFAEFSVQDTGPGIEKENQAEIFERFDRGGREGNMGGLGLGLFIVRQITEAHDGSVSLESEPGRGSAFRIRLPLTGPADKDQI